EAALVETTINLGLRVAAYRNGQARQPRREALRREPVHALPFRARRPEIEMLCNVAAAPAQRRGRRRIDRAIGGDYAVHPPPPPPPRTHPAPTPPPPRHRPRRAQGRVRTGRRPRHRRRPTAG